MYEIKKIKIEDKKIYEGELLLVNREFPIQKECSKALVPCDMNFPDIRLLSAAANHLKLALDKISANGEIIPVSGYRTAGEQTEIFKNSVNENGKEFTFKYVALPFHSEHQTGLAIDLGKASDKIDFIRPNFPYEGICEKFRKIAPYFGFIERYPEKKEDITGISHEPWHFRYIGYPHSKIVSEKEITLEEYLTFIKSFGYGSEYIFKDQGEIMALIYYVPSDGNETFIPVIDGIPYCISGNNFDGFIVTSFCSGIN